MVQNPLESLRESLRNSLTKGFCTLCYHCKTSLNNFVACLWLDTLCQKSIREHLQHSSRLFSCEQWFFCQRLCKKSLNTLKHYVQMADTCSPSTTCIDTGLDNDALCISLISECVQLFKLLLPEHYISLLCSPTQQQKCVCQCQQTDY